VVRTGLDYATYHDVLKNTVHPAGYKMIGKIVIFMRSMLDKVGNPTGITPSLITSTGGAEIIIKILIYLNQSLRQSNEYDWVSYKWLDENKFALNDFKIIEGSVPLARYSICGPSIELFSDLTIPMTIATNEYIPLTINLGSTVVVRDNA
jgi:hypothetical protein